MTDAVRPLSSLPLPQPQFADSSEKQLQSKDRDKLRSTFDEAVAATFYRQMFKSLRASTGKAGLIANSQSEKMFQQQLDEVLIEKMSKASGSSFTSDLFEQQFRDLKPQPQSQPQPDRPGARFQKDV